ncbi:MAG: glycoside hydrolase family 97 protein [Bacteroidales bacterium]|nr:glycoside hydrolase family 97 protein [Bacteroidales bacterium]
MKRKMAVFVILFVFAATAVAKDYRVSSPDGKITVTVKDGPGLIWSASYDGRPVIADAAAGLRLSSGFLPGEKEMVRKAVYGKIDQVLTPVVPVKRSAIPDKCNFMTITYKSGISAQFRVYDDGIAYRFETALKNTIIVSNETADFRLPEGSLSWYPLEDSFMSHNERLYVYTSADTLAEKHLASLPSLFVVNGINVLLTESDIDDYPGMWLRGAGNGRIRGVFPPCPEEERLRSDRDVQVIKAKNYIAETRGTRTFPWRTFIVSPDDGGLIESDLVFRLAAPCRIEDTKWIKPGQVAWDWWNANNIYGVNFRAGINNDTYKYYIDFASKNGIEYVILDEGWYKKGTVLESIPAIDVPELCRYAESRNVGIILWVVWKTFWDRIDEATALYEKWGVKGIKVDFMQRDDQPVVNFYHETMRKAAEHHLLVDFHGAYKPDGAGRTWPNALTREGVKGLENSKWSRDITPDHNLMLPFIRMAAGPMDYTPGAMLNFERNNFTPIFNRPGSLGTRVHQMALYVVFESPLQMLADSPTNYMKEQECTDFIVKVPVTWDDTRVLDARIGDYLLIARKSGSEWFVGALTDWKAREMELDLSFLPAGNYSMEIFRDGINADRHAQDYSHLKQDVKPGDKLKVSMVAGGGWVARITPKQ